MAKEMAPPVGLSAQVDMGSVMELENRNAALKRRSIELERQLALLNKSNKKPDADRDDSAEVHADPDADTGINVIAVIGQLDQGPRRMRVVASVVSSVLGLERRKN